MQDIFFFGTCKSNVKKLLCFNLLFKAFGNEIFSICFLNLPKKIVLKQIESIFLKNQLNDLIIDKVKETMQLQTNIKLDHLEYTTI